MSDQPEVRRLTVREIVEETIAYYSEHPRAVEGGICQYLTTDGHMCAVGRCLLNPQEAQRQQLAADGVKGIDVKQMFSLDADLDAALKPQYRGHTRHFWARLQSLHDPDINWADGGLSSYGRKTAGDIVTTFSEEPTNA